MCMYFYFLHCGTWRRYHRMFVSETVHSYSRDSVVASDVEAASPGQSEAPITMLGVAVTMTAEAAVVSEARHRLSCCRCRTSGT